MTKIIAIINQKGGVGKTTTAVNVAAYMSRSSKSVLLVDLDPQGNATSGLGINKQQLTATMYEVLGGRAKLNEVTLKRDNNLHVAPSNAQLAGSEVELVQVPNREFVLKSALSDASYDVILIDCPPSLGLLSINALIAADQIIIPVQAEYYALEGLGQLLEVVQLVRGGPNPNLDILGLVVTMYDKRTTLSDQVVHELEQHFGAKVFKTVVPRNVRLAEAPSHGKPISDHDKWSKGARAYKQLTKEIIERLALNGGD